VQFEKWQEILAGELLPVYDKPREQAWRHWAAGVAHASRGDSKLAREAAREMDRAIATLRKKSNGEVPEVLEIARMELAGQIEVAANKIERGLRMLSAAARKERSYRYSEPPHYPRPVLEAMGALAMKHGRTSEARAAFEEALKQYPASSRSLQGLAQLGVEHPQHLRAGRESSR
jgi:tetratricopeptide (TPR) repeat protein